jgi:hypothetical protein
MPFLISPDEVIDHLQDTLRTGDRWIFMTNSNDGHDLLVRFAKRKGLHGHPDASCGYASFLNITTGHRGMFSFLTVPKTLLSVHDVARFAEKHSGESVDASRDLIALCETPCSRDTIAAFYLALQEDKISGVSVEGFHQMLAYN